MSEEISQRGSASITLLLTSLFLTSFGIGGQLSSSFATNPVGSVSVHSAAILPQPVIAGKVLGKEIDSYSFDAPNASISASTVSDFLSEVTDPATATPSATAQASNKPTSSPKNTPRPKLIINPKPKVTAKLIKESSPSSTPDIKHATSTPTITAIPSANSLSGDVVLDLVNKHRISIGKPAFVKDSSLCSIAQARAPQVRDELYGGKKMHSGFYALNLPYWATENIAAYSSEEQAVRWWLSDYIHKKAIESDAKYSCAACSGRYCSEIFTSFVKK